MKKVKIQATAVVIVFLASSSMGNSEPKSIDVQKALEKNSIVIKAMKKIGINPIDGGKKLNKALEPTQSIGERSPGKCIDKERSLGNGIIKCKNGYFQE